MSDRPVISRAEDAEYFRKREAQELDASERATDSIIKRLHWEMAQRYAFLASEQESADHPAE